eukprot:gene8813-763_t
MKEGEKKKKRLSFETISPFTKSEKKQKSKKKDHSKQSNQNSIIKSMQYSFQQQKKESTKPSLAGHSMINLQDDPIVVLFGGQEANNERTNNVLIFDTETKQMKNYNWDKSKGTISKFFNFSMTTSEQQPKARDRHTLSLLEENRILLYGGIDDEKYSLNDIWILSTIPNKYKWIQPIVSSKDPQKTPLARHNHTACVYNTNIIIFGGSYLGYLLNDVWMLKETLENEFIWIQLHPGSVHKEETSPIVSDYPGLRFQHSATIIEDKMFIFGGRFRECIYDDLWFFNLSMNSWKEIKIDGLRPSPRYGHSMISIGETFFVLYGIGEDPFSAKEMDNIYKFSDGYWEFIKEDVSNIRMRISSTIIDTDKILFNGGIKYSPNLKSWKHTSSFWTFDTELSKNQKVKKKKTYIGEYEVIKRLGSGAQGIVYLGKKQYTNEQYAVKSMVLDQLTEEEEKKEVSEIMELLPDIKEIQILQQMRHINVLNLVDHFIRKKFDRVELCLVFPYCEQGDLEKYITKKKNILKELELIQLTIQILEGLTYCHQHQILHRDLKPENIFILKEGEKLIFKIADFGLSKNVDKSIAHSVVGSMNFMAPEFFESNNYNFSVDIWSFGVILFLIFEQYNHKRSSNRNYYDFKLSKNRDAIPEFFAEKNWKFSAQYVKIITSCVSSNPKNRPKAIELLEIFKKIEFELKVAPKDEEIKYTDNEDEKIFSNSLGTDSLLFDSQESLGQSDSLLESREKSNYSITSFLEDIGLDQYISGFLSKGYDDFEFLVEYGLTDEDFDSIGITLPGHRRKLNIKLEELKKKNETQQVV